LSLTDGAFGGKGSFSLWDFIPQGENDVPVTKVPSCWDNGSLGRLVLVEDLADLAGKRPWSKRFLEELNLGIASPALTARFINTS